MLRVASCSADWGTQGTRATGWDWSQPPVVDISESRRLERDCVPSWLSSGGSLSRPDRYLTTEIQARGMRTTFTDDNIRMAQIVATDLNSRNTPQTISDTLWWRKDDQTRTTCTQPRIQLILITRSDCRIKGKSPDMIK